MDGDLNMMCHAQKANFTMKKTSMSVKLTPVFFVLFLLTRIAFPQAISKQERMKTISVHIDGFMKSKSGSV